MTHRTSSWIVVGAAFAAMFTVFGVAYSFGAFFEPMAREFGSGHGATSGVFAITAFLWFSLGVLTGWLADRVGPRPVVAAGAGAMSVGLLLTAAVPQLWMGYLTYGLGVGIGTACCYVPMVAAVGGWFERGRALAIGVAVTGIGVGTLVVPPLAALLIASIGWRRTYMAMGLGSLVVLLACAAVAQRPPLAREALGFRPGLAEAIMTREFGLLYLSTVLVSFGVFFAFVHLVPFATSMGVSPVTAAALIGVIGIGSAAGRVLLGAAGDLLGPLNTFRLAVLVLTASYAVWLLSTSFPGLLLTAVLMGLGYGGWVAIAPSVVADLFGLHGLGGNVGAMYTAAAIGGLGGPLLGGFAVDASGIYTLPIAAAGLLALVGLGVLMTLRPPRPVHSTEID